MLTHKPRQPHLQVKPTLCCPECEADCGENDRQRAVCGLEWNDIGKERNGIVSGMWRKRSTCVVVNAILLAFLFLSVSFNKEYLRPAFEGNPVLSVFTGSYANFIAAYAISLFPACPIHTKRFSRTKGMQIVLATATGVFIILTIEGVNPIPS